MDGTLNQPYVFAAAVYGGMMTGGVYVIFQLFIKCFKSSRVATVVFDSLFLVGMMAINGIIMYVATGLKLRPYVFFGMLIGFVVFICAIMPIGRYAKKVLTEKKHVDKRRKKGSNKISRIS